MNKKEKKKYFQSETFSKIMSSFIKCVKCHHPFRKTEPDEELCPVCVTEEQVINRRRVFRCIRRNKV